MPTDVPQPDDAGDEELDDVEMPRRLDVEALMDQLETARARVTPEMQAEWLEDERQKAAERRQTALEQLLPPRFRDVDVRRLDADGEENDRMRRWVEALMHGHHANLVLMGAVGTGKTWSAYALARALHERGRSVRFMPTGVLLDGLRPDGQWTWHPFARADVLMLDDLGATKPSDWTRDQLTLILDERWHQLRPTLVTTNLELPDLEEAIGVRSYDRLMENAWLVEISSGGESRRARR